MKPNLGHALATEALTLIGEISPLVAGSYREGSINTIGAMLMMASIEQERAAENSVNSITDMMALFMEAGAIVDGDLSERLKAAADREIESYLVSSLSAHRDDLQRLLIELQTYAEAMGAGGQALRKRIWGVLEREADRNIMALG
ncbi:MAG: hypothetical protein EP347_07710 [Alphaproteobacteria bacterium]|nr:MAG: hypothetical protein EP347_07710 [Alphaproteobacteria bacterium]